MASKPCSRAALALAALLALGAFAALAPPAHAQDAKMEFMVLGETHGTKSMTRTLVGIAADKGATGCVCPGDFIYGDAAATPSGWRSMMQPFMGGMLPARGNHDYPWSAWSSMFPAGASWYAKDVNGVQFIALSTEHSLASGSTQRAWLEDRLQERGEEALKVVFMHRPWWLPSGARHPSSEFESKNGASADAMEALMEQHGVDLVVSAHEKNYQHSLDDGVHYLVAGGGGSSFYDMGYTLPHAVKRLKANVVSTLEFSASSMTIKSYDLSGAKVEEFTMTGGAPSAPAPSAPPSGDVTFAPGGGNDWWVEVDVQGSGISGVDARDTDGAWVALAKKSWGDWAASFHIEPGHDVQYRATFSDGRVAESCWVDHPRVACASTASAPGDPGSWSASFSNVRGNAWWVEADVDVAGGTLARVEARVDEAPWTALESKSWGSWAKSMRAPDGSTVQLRAVSTTGTVSPVSSHAWLP